MTVQSLTRLRERAGYRSAQALAAAMKVHRNTVLNWQSGESCVSLIEAGRLATLLGVSLETLELTFLAARRNFSNRTASSPRLRARTSPLPAATALAETSARGSR